jgi:hypothetical protein
MSPRRRAFRKWSFIVMHPIKTRRHLRAARAPWPPLPTD